MKVIHIITGLNNGGAEGVLYRLCKYDNKHQHIVISMMDEGKYGSLLEDIGIDVYCLNMPQGRVSLSGLLRLFKLLRKYKPDVVQTWMYHADLIGGVIAKFAGIKSVYWNIRSSDLDAITSKRSTWFVAKLCAKLSYLVPEAVVCCAQRAKEFHLHLGYKNNFVIIGNGYDLSELKPNSKLRTDFRNEFNIDDNQILIGMVARYDAQKDHLNLINSLRIVKDKGYKFKCLLVGRDLNSNNSVIVSAINDCMLCHDIMLLDQRSDIQKVMNGLDIHILSSAYGEGFPNAVAESMSCGTPNIVTDVGDAGLIVGDTGIVVIPRSSTDLADAISNLLNTIIRDPEKWSEICVNAYKRARDNFDINIMVINYHSVWGFK